ncbi:minor extracellular protease vpr [Polyplosphaeria fusca]|uniref:Minor extracellular protease vpr n=1 Tax=Polyplosphaeria fusca TaxID=682080 RepID=A0A9P4UW32_9PLEO|nr:minor extracellular protease vpr [Polyplosphaeria fusca]
MLNFAFVVLFLLAPEALAIKPSTDALSAPIKDYIVEFSDGPLPRDLTAGNAAKILKSYDSPIFRGAHVEISRDADVQKYTSAAHVVNIWPNHVVRLDPPLDRQSFIDDVSATNYSVHSATGVDKLHAAGILGQGVKVGVVDSGIWYKHPALGGGFGPGFKVAGGWDFVGDATSPGALKQPDGDPLDTPDIGHGTHVAGIIAASSDHFMGVAPNATLYAYKVMAAYEGTDDATMIDAWLRAYADDMDVITTSIGGRGGWSESSAAVVASRIAQSGVVMTFSAGNSGDNGLFYGGSAGSSADVLTVASVQSSMSPASGYQLTISRDGVSNTTTSGYLSSDGDFPREVKDWPVIALNLDIENPSDACTPFPDGTRNLTGAIAVVRRGGCTYVEKQKVLQALGAKYVLVYNDNRPITSPGATDPGSLLVMITAEAGHAIVKAIAAGANVTADFSQDLPEVGQPDLAAGNTPNTFSSWAATYELELKPDIAAPGGNIFSTWPDNGYMVQSGTSMATPYIAGIAALYISALGGRKTHGSQFATDFNQRVTAAGQSLSWYNGTAKDEHFIAPPLQMGSGLVNASKVLFTETTTDQTKFHLNDTSNFQPSHEITITNNGAAAVSYTFALEPAAGFEIFDPFIATFDTWGIKLFANLVPQEMTPDVQLPDAFSLGPGESKKVTLTFNNPKDKGWNATLIPVYSGKILLTGDSGDQLSLPYIGVASSLYHDKKVHKKNSPSSFSTVIGSTAGWTPIDEKSSYTFNPAKNGTDAVMLFTAFDWGVRELRWDIFSSNWSESDWAYPPSKAKGFVGPVARLLSEEAVLSNTDLANQTVVMPSTLLGRDGMNPPTQSRYWWMGQLGNGSQIAPGYYTMRVAASRPLADLGRTDGWEVWRHEIRVLP